MLRTSNVGTMQTEPSEDSLSRAPGHADGPASSTFESQAAYALEGLRESLAGLVRALPQVERAADLRRTLDLDAALAWQIHTLATSDDVLRAGRVIPKSGAMERLIRAARAVQLEESLVQRVQEAYRAFERTVEEHAGDRETFDAILAAMRPDDGVALQKTRRNAFKANAALWGVSVRTTVNCVIFNERPTGEHDCLSIRARIDVRRLREGGAIAVYASSRTWGGPSCPPEGTPNVAVDACELIPEACSTPVPPLNRCEMPDGTWRDFVRLEGLGRSSEVTVFWRTLSLNFPGGSRTPPHGCTTPCLEPTEATVINLLVPRGWSDPSTVRSLMAPADSQFLPAGATGPAAMPFEGSAEHLGNRMAALYTRHAPMLPEIVSRELARVGWDPAGFDIYRCVVTYPVLHAAVHLFVDGPRAEAP